MLTQACKFTPLVLGNNPLGFKKSEKKKRQVRLFKRDGHKTVRFGRSVHTKHMWRYSPCFLHTWHDSDMCTHRHDNAHKQTVAALTNGLCLIKADINKNNICSLGDEAIGRLIRKTARIARIKPVKLYNLFSFLI